MMHAPWGGCRQHHGRRRLRNTEGVRGPVLAQNGKPTVEVDSQIKRGNKALCRGELQGPRGAATRQLVSNRINKALRLGRAAVKDIKVRGVTLDPGKLKGIWVTEAVELSPHEAPQVSRGPAAVAAIRTAATVVFGNL